MLLKQSVARNLAFLMIDEADHVTGLAGLTVTVTLSKNGGAFAAAAGAVTDRGNGWYSIALTTVDTNTLGDLALHATSTGADPTDLVRQVVVGLPGEDAATIAAIAAALATAAANVVDIKTKTDALPEGIRRNQPFDNFTFFMAASGDHVTGKTALTVTAERRLDNGIFEPCENAPTEVDGGVYSIDLDALDLDAEFVTLRFTSTGADATLVSFRPAP